MFVYQRFRQDGRISSSARPSGMSWPRFWWCTTTCCRQIGADLELSLCFFLRKNHAMGRSNRQNPRGRSDAVVVGRFLLEDHRSKNTLRCRFALCIFSGGYIVWAIWILNREIWVSWQQQGQNIREWGWKYQFYNHVSYNLTIKWLVSQCFISP